MNSLAATSGTSVRWKKQRVSIICYLSCKKEGNLRTFTDLLICEKKKCWKDKPDTNESNYLHRWWGRMGRENGGGTVQ